MVLMALDHTRDFFHAGAMTFSPEDLTRTTPLLFLTRWITHVCAPVFLFTAGVGAFLRLQRPGSTKAQLSRFLWTRGLWLVFLELTVMRVAINFSLDARYPVLLLVIWALGVSMIALAALIHLPHRVLAVLSIAVIALHNGLDGVQAVAVRRGRRALECAPPARRLLRGGCASGGRLSAGAVGRGDGGGLLRRPRCPARAAGAPAIPVAVGHSSHRGLRAACARSTSTAIRSRGPRSHRQYSPSSRF